jgi:alpha-L-fucosidase
VFDIPRDTIALKGVRNEIERVWAVGHGAKLTWERSGGAPWKNIPGILLVDVPEAVLDDDVTVVGVRLKGPLDLYRGAGDAVEAD